MKRAAHLLAVLCVVALAATPTLAGGKKPPDGGDTGGGTIYFSSWSSGVGQVWSMNSDGTAKTPLPVYLGADLMAAEPSRLLHDEHRWFLQFHQMGIYPDGMEWFEVFAVSDDGVTTQLTFDPYLEELPRGMSSLGLRWSPGDAKVSWRARYRDPDTGELLEGGIYSLEIGFAADGTPVPIGDLVLEVPAGWVYDEWRGWVPDISEYDWSPDDTRIVYDYVETEPWVGGLAVVNLASGISSDLTPDGRAPTWQPDGETIAFTSAIGVETINANDPENTRELILAPNPNKGGRAVSYFYAAPQWSPTGSHLAYNCLEINYQDFHRSECDVHRAEADGSSDANLTGDVDDWASGYGWR